MYCVWAGARTVVHLITPAIVLTLAKVVINAVEHSSCGVVFYWIASSSLEFLRLRYAVQAMPTVLTKGIWN